ncbi:MAG: TldD/PmbA family protein, partial [Deltaproteobacteria bacterium]|nr:TldD/PmbA family protein [Deltaproteobacteria bacterium]
YDDGLIKGGWSSSLFDGEGVSRQRTPLIVEGLCEGYLYDSYWGGRAGKPSTGNATRGGFKGALGIGTSNFYIEKGKEDLKTLLSSVGDGLFITDVMGVHMIDAVSGDFSLGASGMRVEGGELTTPVRGMAISGNILELFSRVEAVGSDLRFVGSVGAPSLLVADVEASGS